MNNNIEQLDTQQQDIPKTPFQDVDFSFTSLAKETQEARDQALFNNLSGAPVIPETPTTTNITAAVDTPEITDSFTTRDEVMARLGLMKEDYSYTDTYTNYINQGGTPLPGYETAHTQILAQEKAEAYFKQEEEGLIDHDTALMEAYGRDILATMGYDVTSVAYWQNKFMNDDFSHPFHNRYLMDQVLTAAEEYKKTREASEWGKSQISNTQIAQLAGEELSAKQVKQIFGDIGTYATTQKIKDEDLMRQILSGSIAATSRLRQIDETHFAFLHTDGKLHVLEKGKDIIFDSKGNVKEISVNGGDGGDFLDHFASSFAAVVPTVVKLGDFLISIPDIISGDADALAERLQATDAWFNSESPLAEIHRLDHIDLDGFNFEAKDIMMTIADISGMLAGNWCVGKIATAGTDIAGGLLKYSADSSHSMLSRAGAWTLGRTTKVVSTLGLRSTGWYAGVSNPTAFTMFGKELVKPSALGMWLNHGLKVAPVYFMKDFNQTLQQMQQANISLMLQGKEAAFTEKDMLDRALKAAGINYGLNMAFASAQGITAMERWGLNKQTANWDTIRRYNDRALNKAAQKLANGITSKDFKQYMMRFSNIIGLNSFADALATVAGNQIQSWQTATTKDGKAYKGTLAQFLAGDDELGGEYAQGLITRKSFWKDLVQTGVMQISEYARNKREANLYYYSGIMNLQEGNTLYLQKLKDAVDNEKDVKKRNDLNTVYQNYLNDLNSTKGTMEEKIIKAMDNLSLNVGRMPDGLKEVFDDVITRDKQKYFYVLGQTIEYGRQYQKTQMAKSKMAALGDKKHLSDTASKASAKFKDYMAGRTFKGKDAQIKFLTEQWDANLNSTIENYYKATGQMAANKLLQDLFTPRNVDFSDAVEIITDGYEGKISDDYDNEAYTIYRVKQEAQLNEKAKVYDQPRLKGRVFKATMQILKDEIQDGSIIQIDENTFAMFNALDPIAETTILETQAKLNHALLAIKDQPVVSSHLIMAALIGDEGYKASNFQQNYDALKKTLDYAVSNNILLPEEAAEVIWILSNSTSGIKGQEEFSDEFNKLLTDKVYNTASRSTLEDMSDVELYLRYTHAVDIVQNKPKGSAEYKQALDMLTQDGVLAEKLHKFFVYQEKLGHVQKGFTAKLDAAILSGDGGRFPLGDTYLDSLLQSSEDEVGGKSVEWEDKRLTVYQKMKDSKDSNYQFYVMLQETDQLLEDYDEQTKEYKTTGSIVSINLGGLSGKATHKLYNEYRSMILAAQEGAHLDTDRLKNSSQMSAVNAEYKTKVELSKEFGDKTILNFDLTDPNQFEAFKYVASKLELFGNRDYDSLTIDEAKDNIKRMNNGWENDVQFKDGLFKYLTIDDAIQKKLEKNFRSIDFSKIKQEQGYYDEEGNFKSFGIPEKIKQIAEIHKVSNKVQRVPKFKEEGGVVKKILNIIPLPFKNKKEKSTYANIENETDIQLGKSGIEAKGRKEKTRTFDTLETADEYTRNRELGTYYFLRTIIEEVDDPIKFRFNYYGNTKDLKKKLTSAGIIGSKGFYEIDELASPEGMLTIKPKDNAKEMMRDYLETSSDSDFNVIKILPLLSDKMLDKQLYLGSEITNGTITFRNKNGELVQNIPLPDMYNGNNTYHDHGLQQIFNMASGFDEDGSIKSYIIGSIAQANANGETYFNPFVSKISSSKSIKENIYNAYINKDIAALESYNDYEASYLKDLLLLEKEFESLSTDEDFKVLLQNNKVVKYLEDNFDVDTGDFKVSLDELKEGVKNTYIGSSRKIYQAENIEYDFSSSPYAARRYSNDADAYAINGSIYNKISAQEYYIDLQDPDNIEYIDSIIDKAISTFKTVATDTTYSYNFSSPDTICLFQENNVGRVLQGLVANEGHLQVEDYDEILNMDAEARRQFADATGLKESEVKRIVSIAEKFAETMGKIDQSFSGKRINEWRQLINNISTPSQRQTNKNISMSGTNLNALSRDLLRHHYRKENGNEIVELPDAFYIDRTNKLVGETGKPFSIEDRFKSFINSVHDTVIRNKFNSPDTAIIYNMENAFGLDHAIEVMSRTKDRVALLTDDEYAQNKIAKDMYFSATQFTRDREFQQLKIYNEKGEDILHGDFNGHNFFEIYTKLQDLDIKDGYSFVVLQRHTMDSYDGINFKYMKLNAETFNDLQQYYLIRALDNYREQHYPSQDFETFRNNLLRDQETNRDEFLKTINWISNSQLSKATQRKILINNVLDVLKDKNYSKQDVINALIPPVISNKRWGNEGINNYINGLASSLDSENSAEVSEANLALLGIDINSLSDRKITKLSNSRNDLISTLQTLSEDDIEQITDISSYAPSSDEYKSKLETFLTNPEITQQQKLEALKLLIASSKDASMLAYRTSGVFSDVLRDKNKLLEISMPSVEYHTGVDNTKGSIKLNEINSEDIIDFDFEGIIPGTYNGKIVTSSGTLKDVFQVSFSYYNKETEETELKTIFITHDGYTSTQDYAEKNGLLENEYNKDNPGYAQAVKQYVSGDTSGEAIFMSEDEFINFLQQFNGKTMVAFNGDKYDFQYVNKFLPNSKFIDATQFNDLLDTGTGMYRRTTSSLVLRDLTDKIDDLAKTHNSEQDTSILREWRENRINSFIDPTINSKQRFVNIVDNYIMHAGFENPDEIYAELDKTFKELYDNGNFKDEFGQGMLNASETTYIVRQLNHLREENIGNALYEFRNDPQLFIDTGTLHLQKAITNNTLINKALEVVAERMYLDDSLTAFQALKQIEDEVFLSADKNSKEYVDPMLKILDMEIDPNIKNTEEFSNLVKQLRTKGQKYGSKYSFVENINSYKDNKFWGKTSSLNHHTKEVSDSFDFETNEVKEWFEDQLLTLLSGDKNKGLEQFDYEIQERINSRTAQKTYDQLKANYDGIKGIIFFKKGGVNKRVTSLDYGPQELNVLTYDANTHYLTANPTKQTVDIGSSTIVMDRRSFTQMCRANSDRGIIDRTYDNIFNEDGSVYVTMLRQPSAFLGSEQFFKVIVVEGDQGMVSTTPATWRALFAGDFDGDSSSLVPVDSEMGKKLAKFSTENLSTATDIQEALYKDMTTQGLNGKIIYRKADRNTMLDVLQVGNTKEMIEVSKEIDKYLKSHNGIITENDIEILRGKFDKALEKIQAKEDIPERIAMLTSDDVWNVIGIKQGDNYVYINNYNVLYNTKSFSFKQAILPQIFAAGEKTNMADSMTGFEKQRFMYPEVIINNMEIDPLKKLDLYGDRIGSDLISLINSTDWVKSSEAISSYFETIKSTILKGESDKQYKLSLSLNLDEIRDSILDFEKNAIDSGMSKQSINDEISKKMFANTYQILVNINNSLRDNETLNNELSTIFTTTKPDDTFRNQLDQHLKFNKMLKDLEGTKVKVSGDSFTIGDDAQLENMIFNEIEKQSNASDRTQFISSFGKTFGDDSLVTIAVIDDNQHNVGDPDTMYVNMHSNLRHVKEGYDISKSQMQMFYQINPKGSEEKVPIITYETKSYFLDNLRELKETDRPSFNKDRQFLEKVITDLEPGQDIVFVGSEKRKTLLIRESVNGKKGYAIGKGMLKDFSDIDGFDAGKTSDIDIIINKPSRLDKIPVGSRFGPVSERVNVSFQIGPNKYVNRTVKIFKNVPFELLEDFNYTVGGKLQKKDLMTILAEGRGLTAINDLGSVVFKENADGSYSFDNSEIAQLINSENDSRGIGWANGIGVELVGRNLALKKIISQENLWGKFNDYVNNALGTKVANFRNGKELEIFMSNFSKGSIEMYNISETLRKFLLKEGYTLDALLERMNEHERNCFSRAVQDYLDYNISGTFKNNAAEATITSKHHAHENVAPFRFLTKGIRLNPSQEEHSGHTRYITSDVLYMPMNKVYANHNNGFPINKYDALDLTRNGIVSHEEHEPISYISNFNPIADTRNAVEIPEALSNHPYMNDPKSGHSALPDKDVLFPSNESVFAMKGTEGTIGPYAANRSRGILNVAFGKEAINAPTKTTRDGLLLNSLINADSIPEALAESTSRNVAKDIVLNGYSQGWEYKDGNLVYSLNPEQRIGSYNYLTSKGKDFVSSKYNFFTFKDVFDNVEKPEIDIKKVPNIQKTSNNKPDLSELFQGDHDIENPMVSRTRMNLSTGIEFETGRKDVDVFKNDWFQSQGIHIDANDKGDTMAISMGLENALGEANMLIADGDEYLATIRRTLTGYNTKAFEDYCMYEGLQSMESKGEPIDDMLNYIGVDRNYYNTIMKANHEKLKNDAKFSSALESYINFRESLNRKVADLYNDPFAGMTFDFLTSFVPSEKYKNIRNTKIHNAIIQNLNFSKYSPKDYNDNFKPNMMFDFFKANKSMHAEIAKMLSVNNVTAVLHNRNMMDNVDVVNKLTDYLSNSFDVSNIRKLNDKYHPEDSEIHNTILNVVKMKTDIDLDKYLRAAKGKPEEQIKIAWNATTNRVQELREQLSELTQESYSYTDINKKLANQEYSRDVEPIARAAYNAMTAQIILAQRIMELDPRVAKNASSLFNSIYKDGYTFANKQGQKLEKGSHIKPISNLDTKYLVDNIEIAANSQTEEKWNQYLVELALRGELYTMKKDLADQLADKFYTRKSDGWLMSHLKKISSVSAAIQMSMPLKMMSRVTRFTGTDYNLAATYSFKTIPNIARAAKELSAAIYSKGASVKEGSDLYEYLIREGQPLNVTNKEPITFQESVPDAISKITDKMTKPLAYQNHLGRYAIWLTAKESFDNNDPIYGPTYYLHNQIDSLTKLDDKGNVVPDNASKAMFVMDHVIGSPGGFPYLSKKTNGLMMFATFPMNLTRTAGAYGMSLATLFNEGYTSDNAPQWARTIASPSAAVIIGGYIGTMLISSICDKYGVDEKTKKKWIEEQVAIDPLATFIGGTPSVTFDSLNPYNQLKEMFVNPWTSEYNKNLGDKALGFLSQNVLSKLNPAIKTPAELLVQRDFANGSTIDTSKNYTRYENGMRKMLGFMIGSGVANNIVDQLKIDNSSNNSNFLDSLWRGLSKGFANDLGNQKSWKKDTSNYYSMIDTLATYKRALSRTETAEYEDLTDVNYMRDQRKYSNSYGEFNSEDYSRVNKMLRKMIKDKENPTKVYTYIAEEYNKGTSEATLRAALNNNSLVRMIASLKQKDFYNTLSSKDLENLEKALLFEQEMYPMLKDFFPVSPYYNYKLPNRKKYYGSSSGGSYTTYPKTVYPRTIPGMYSNGYTNKYSNNVKHLQPERVDMNVSPQMGVWVQDYNKVTDLNHWTNNTYQKQKPLSHGGGK